MIISFGLFFFGRFAYFFTSNADKMASLRLKPLRREFANTVFTHHSHQFASFVVKLFSSLIWSILLKQSYPILEFDSAREAMLEPRHFGKGNDFPEHCVLCFFDEVLSKLPQTGRAKKTGRLFSAMGAHPVFQIKFDGKPVVVFHPGMGAPFAAVMLEELIASGCHKFIACGGAGVLDSNIAVGQIVVPTHAVRDEGTSYHYLPPGREAEASPEAISAIEKILQKGNIPYRLGKTWTTDAVYRETAAKVALRKAEGCCVVEMEAAAFFAIAHFRQVHFGHLGRHVRHRRTRPWPRPA